MSSHNKKRSSGLLYEFLVREISKTLVDGDTKRSSDAMKVLKRHFKVGTEIYREFKLIDALVRTTVSSEHVAANILLEAKAAARTHSTDKLRDEKSALLADITRTLNSSDVFEHHIPDYKIYATAQILLNEWRKQSQGSADLSKIASYEDSIIHWLTTKKDPVSSSMMNEESPGTNRLLMHVMMKKLHEKYDGVLSPRQASIIKSYALSNVRDDQITVKNKLTEVRTSLLEQIDEYVSSNSNEKYVVEKLKEIRSTIHEENLGTVDDETVTRFLQYVKLHEELTSEE
jgi:hypothetical protein